MTSQIGMMNKNSVALASDSAGTWNHTQAYNTSDKIYQLAGRQSVGFMTNGPGGYMGLSWDRIMGMYREHIGTRGDDFKVKELCWITMPIPDEDYEEGLKWFNGEETALDAPHKGPRKGRYQPGYLEDFIRFINTNPHLQDEMTKSNGMLYEIKEDIDFHNIGPTFKALDGLVNLLQQQEKARPHTKSSIMERQGKLHKQYSKMFEENLIHFSEWNSNRLDDDPDLVSKRDEVISEETQLISRLCESYRDIMYGKRISRAMRGALGNIVGCYVATEKWKSSSAGSGIIIAGFGEKEELPTMVHLRIMSKWKDQMRYEIEEVYNDDCAIPFAQADQINTIIYGLSPAIQRRLYNYSNGGHLPHVLRQELERVSVNTSGVGDKITKKLLETQKEMNKDDDMRFPKIVRQLLSPLSDEDIRNEETWGNLDPFVYRLAPPDLADVAEKMVELESTMQYVKNGMGAQVGGPIDVVSITKEDGLIWIKRKSKIDKELNPRVFLTPRERASHI